jgi:transcriptional regulator with XRE-family HTH domain
MRKASHSELYDLFRFYLTRARQRAGLKQSDLAEKLGRPQAFVSRYETGERRLDVIEFLEVARALAVEPAEILGKLKLPEE